LPFTFTGIHTIETDSRFSAYQDQFGDESWELDALDPNTLLAIIQAATDEVKDSDLFDEMAEREEAWREILSKASERWADVASFLEARLRADTPRRSSSADPMSDPPIKIRTHPANF